MWSSTAATMSLAQSNKQVTKCFVSNADITLASFLADQPKTAPEEIASGPGTAAAVSQQPRTAQELPPRRAASGADGDDKAKFTCCGIGGRSKAGRRR